jgi:hypothetical protein
MKSKIIVMLTHNDKTVENALSVFDSSKDLDVCFWGFKDVGLSKPKMKELVDAMKRANKKTFLEVVTYTTEECLAGAKLAVELGFDYLMGTIYHESVMNYIKNQKINYLPFCGKVYGSPSILEGDIPLIIDNAKWLLNQGVYGIDLLAFRHADGIGLTEAYCASIKKPVVIAGSINSKERINFINRVNPWAFTMGSALFTQNFAPQKDFRTNLQTVLEYIQSSK